jgi:hypothetical protein
MTLVPICIQFLELLWPDDRPSWVRNWSPFNKRIHKSVLVVTGDFQIAFVEEIRTQPLYCDRQYG